jgi:heme-degrading monooxygenase HmoA
MHKLIYHSLNKFIHQLKSSLIVGLLVLALFGMFSNSAQASKAMKALAFDATSGMVEVASVYETSYPAQKTVAKSLKNSSKLMKKAAGFKGLSMLQSQDGKQIIMLSQWQDLASYQAYTPPEITTSSKGKASAPPPAPTQTLIFEVETAQTAIEGATPALRGKEAVVQLTQFAAKSPEAQSKVLTQVEAMIPEVLQKQPIPQSVVLLKAVDDGVVTLLTNWNCSALFEDVGEPGALEPSSDLVALADSEQNLYSVVSIIPAEAEDDGEGDFKKGKYYD